MTSVSQRFFQNLELEKELYFKRKVDLSIYSNRTELDEILGYRDWYTWKYMWFLLDDTSLNEIVTFIKGINVATILEVCSGYGLFAALLESHGIFVKTTDILKQNKVWSYKNDCIEEIFTDCVTKVEVLSSEAAVEKYQADMLVCCWPRKNTVLPCLPKYKGKYILYIGELESGSCEGSKFFNYVEELFELIETIYIPKFCSARDFCDVYRRK